MLQHILGNFCKCVEAMAMHIEILAHFGVVPHFKLEKLIENPLTLKLYISGSIE